jgi:Fic family protein
MLDNNWEMINGPHAHHIEQLNAANTINVMEAIVTFSIAQTGPQQSVPGMPNELALQEVHRSGTLFLLHKPGVYRDVPVHVADLATGAIIYQPPPPEDVPRLMTEFFVELDRIWNSNDALDSAAFALWRINWVHPFKNGNGRTARVFAYACLCARLGIVLPGTTTVIDQIMSSRPEYEAAIRAADRAAANNDGRDCSQMRDYLNRLLQIQIASI